jgi:hypothetical protein
MSGALSSQCYVEVLPNAAMLAGCHDQGIQVLPKPGERRCWVPVGVLLTDEQQREWRFLLECWCLYSNLEMRPLRRSGSVPGYGDADEYGATAEGVEVALTPAQILEFLDWACGVARHEKPGVTLAAAHLQRLRAFLADDVNASDEIRVIAAQS